MNSQHLQRRSPAAGSSDAISVVKTDSLSFSWPGGWFTPPKPLFTNVNLEISPGELVGLSAPSGSGKSTLGDTLLGLRMPTRGQVYWNGRGIYQGNRFVDPFSHTPLTGREPQKTERTERERCKRDLPLRCRFQKIYQDPVASFPPKQSLGEAFLDLIHTHGIQQDEDMKDEDDGANTSHGNSDTGKQVRSKEKPSSKEKKRGGTPGTLPKLRAFMSGKLERLGLEAEMLERYPHQLSGGEMQRMALARVMLLKPCFIVADEPTSRLDLSVQAHIIHLIADFSRKEKCAVLLISHDNALIQSVCHRSICL